jgi:hypothetical protein
MSTNNEKLTAESIERILMGFCGTMTYHPHSLGGKTLLLTEGCDFIRQALGAYWLFDLIASYQGPALQGLYMQVWTITREIDKTNAVITCEDGDRHVIIIQDIPYTDFLLTSLTIWVVDNVAMLPTEN